jgi:hypothetical protein
LAGVPAVAIVFALPDDVVLAQNAARSDRVVDPAIVARHLAAVRRGIDRLAAEGFDRVVVLPTRVEADSVEVRRG